MKQWWRAGRDKRRRTESEEYHRSAGGATRYGQVHAAGIGNPAAGNRGGSRYWLVIILIAVAVHLFLLIGIKSSHFAVFRRSIDNSIASSSPPAAFPDAIIAIIIDEEGEEMLPVEIEPTPEKEPEEGDPDVEDPGDDPEASETLIDFSGEPNAPMPSRPATRSAVIPPMPIEITWPETSNMSHCMGLHVDVRIRVSDKGRILAVEPADSSLPEDCAAAALRTARRIVFLPGTVDGNPETMWTEIRIDFREHSP